MSLEYSNEEEEDSSMTEAEKENSGIIDANIRQVFNPETGVFDTRNLRATDVKENKLVILLGDGSVKLETQLEFQK